MSIWINRAGTGKSRIRKTALECLSDDMDSELKNSEFLGVQDWFREWTQYSETGVSDTMRITGKGRLNKEITALKAKEENDTATTEEKIELWEKGNPEIEEHIDGSGEVKLAYQFRNVKANTPAGEVGDHMAYLTFDKKRDMEVIETTELKKGKYESVLNMVPGFQNWKGEEIFKPEKPTPNAITIKPRGRLEFASEDDDSLYKMDSVNVSVDGKNVNSLLIVAQFGKKNQADYEEIISKKMTRD
ncbi:14501_t:CDS:2 [Funneliformis geosporum]|uniref:14501_t:CDS:1 n=1 Tax=Funneliformis geosporum TaxID=1117311 RepID=A0A9W4SK58_9GLOM|nr:14501_t:CDS:2 [Funneliformis geosporum]